MLQNPSQFRCHGIESANRNTEFAVVERSSPGRRAGHIKESLFRVERHKNVVARGRAQVALQIVVIRFERGQDLSAEILGRLLAFVVEHEVAAFALGEIGLYTLLALRFRQVLLHGGIGTQIKGMLPRGDGLFGAIAGLLRIA